MISVSAPVPLTSAITGASVLALSLIMLVCSCLVCKARRKLCFEGNIGHQTLTLLSWQCFRFPSREGAGGRQQVLEPQGGVQGVAGEWEPGEGGQPARARHPAQSQPALHQGVRTVEGQGTEWLTGENLLWRYSKPLKISRASHHLETLLKVASSDNTISLAAHKETLTKTKLLSSGSTHLSLLDSLSGNV